jgi:hypothetical protein
MPDDSGCSPQIIDGVLMCSIHEVPLDDLFDDRSVIKSRRCPVSLIEFPRTTTDDWFDEMGV